LKSSIKFALSFVIVGSLTSLTAAQASMSTPTRPPLAVGQGAAAPDGGSFLNSPIPANVLKIPLVDSAGKTFTLGSLKGQTLVIANFLTSCQEICPMTSINMRNIGDAVSASSLKSKVKVLEVSVDGARDTPTRLTAYQTLFQDKSWTLASGSDSNLKKFWAYFGSSNTKVAYTAAQKKSLPLDWQTSKINEYDVTHTDMVIIIDGKGTWSWLDLGNPNPGKAVIPAKLKKYLSAEGLDNLAKPQEPSWDAEAVLSALSSITGTKIG
jgi:cytochrome oxidase Cu insertion factor (SCO1/SenC/PrrC family)